MLMFWLPIVLLFTTILPVLGDVTISKPLKGSTFSASSGSAKVEIAWIESNSVPKLSAIESYTFVLCSGPNSKIDAVETLQKEVSPTDVSGNSINIDIDASLGADGPYYIQVYAKAETGYTIHYTYRFTLTDMTGTYKPSGNDPSPPSAEIAVNGGTTIVPIDSKSFTIPYTQQTGSTRFAPMQTQPGSRVTKDRTAWKRRFETSAVTFFSKIRASPDQVSTLTPGWSYTVSSAVNWASVAAPPSVWYPASARLTKAATTYTPDVLRRTSSASPVTATSS